MNDQLFAAIRRGKIKPGMGDEFAKRVKAGALQVMQKMDGFRGYYLVAGADDTIIAVSLFTNKAVAETSTQTLMPWIKENLGPLLASPTEAIDGTVVVMVTVGTIGRVPTGCTLSAHSGHRLVRRTCLLLTQSGHQHVKGLS